MNNWRQKRTGILALAGFFLLGSVTAVFAAPLPGGTLNPTSIPQYVIPLVIPPVIKDSVGDNSTEDYEIAVRQFKQQILPGGIWNTLNGRSDTFPATTIWSYGPAADPMPNSTDLGGGPGIAPAANSQFNYPAYTFETLAAAPYGPGGPVDVRWINELVNNPVRCFDNRGERIFPPGINCNFLPHLLPIDQTLHWANPQKLCIDGSFRTDCRGFIPSPYMGPVPIVTHVHGSHVETHSDGYPEAWWLPAADNIPAGYATHGALFDDATGNNPGNTGYADYSYRNDQPATTAWYHDHSLGMTRSNVYAGPAGFWLIRGGQYDGATVEGTDRLAVLPAPAPAAGEGVLTVNVTDRAKYREIPIVIQDRSFNADGSLFYPDNRAFFENLANNQLRIPFIPSPRSDISPIWNPEAFFNVMVVNGVSWPIHEVAPALYRLRFLDGCNSRFLWLKFKTMTADEPEVQVYQIGAEQGFLPEPVLMNNNLDGSDDGTAQLLIALAERADVLVDFRGLADGTEIELLNVGPDEPFGGGVPCPPGENPDDNPGCGDFAAADPGTTGKVMKFVVNTTLADAGGPYGASPTDPVNPDGTPNPHAATDPEDLALHAEPALGPPTTDSSFRNVSLNEASSELICATTAPNGQVRPVTPPVPPGDDFETRCQDAGGEPFGPREALLGTVNISDSGAEGVALMWTDTTGISQPVEYTLHQNGDNPEVVTVNVTENPFFENIELWNIYNFTEDAHPIHLHLVRFQVVNRQAMDPDTNLPSGPVMAPEPWEDGYKDTVIAYPGQVTRVKADFDIVGLYVWHCHIVEHEDNEMMRPFIVSEAPPAPD